jgi:hypothetical protein
MDAASGTLGEDIAANLRHARHGWSRMSKDLSLSIESARLQATLACAPFREWSLPDGTPGTTFYREGSDYLLRFPGLADFRVSTDACAVTCVPAPGTAEATLQHLYLNQVLPLTLGKQGKLVFHASAVEVAESAVAFVAESGRGKSTLAATFATHGCRFLTDEGLVLEEAAGVHRVMPSHPSIRLWDDSQAALLAPNAAMAPPLSFTPKSRFLAGGDLAFCPEPRPLRRAYFLGDGSATEIRIEKISAAEAMVEWVKSSFLLDIEEKPRLASHFDQVAKLAERPIHFRLDYPRRFELLASVRKAIVEHAAAAAG